MSDHDIVFWTFIITAIGVFFALVGIVVAIWTLRGSAKIARAQFWVMMRDLLANYDDVHGNLRPSGKWATTPCSGPEDAYEWARVQLYMGTFEYCESLIRQGLLDEREFCKHYGYRLNNIVSNDVIVKAKLIEQGKYWIDFCNICKRCGAHVSADACANKPSIEVTR